MLIFILQYENFSFQNLNSTFIRHLNRCNLGKKISYKPSLIRKKEHHTRRCWIISDTFYPAGPINGVYQCYQARMCINIPIKPHAHTSKDTGDQRSPFSFLVLFQYAQNLSLKCTKKVERLQGCVFITC